MLEQSIPFEVGGTSTLSYRKEGFALVVTLPKAVATCVAFGATDAPELLLHESRSLAEDTPELVVLLGCTLLVEDNLFIAVDAENTLFKLGAGSVEIVKTGAEALTALAERDFTFALLDVNLGGENSLPIALTLRTKAVPFVFGTGYGEIIGMPHSLGQTELVSKPYSRHSVRAALQRVSAATSPLRDRFHGRAGEPGPPLPTIAIVPPSAASDDSEAFEPTV